MKLFSVVALTLVSTAAALGQGRVYVSPGATGDGSSWTNATGDLAAAMASALAGTEIWVARGTYVPTVCVNGCDDADRLASFRLRAGVSVIGGFTGVETDAAEASPANVTVLSGDIGLPGDPSDNSYTVVDCDDCGDAAAMSKLTIAAGNADRAGANITQRGRAGAGLYLDASDGGVASPTFTAVSVVNNDSRGQGGGIYLNGFRNGDASPVFERCLIAFNTSRADGGGVYVLALDGQSSPTFSNTVLRNNGTVNPGNRSGQSGAAIYVSATDGRAEVTLERCLLTRNTADVSTPGFNNGNSSANGGAVYLTAGSANPDMRLVVRNSVLSHNSAYSGGAVYNNRGTVDLANVSVVANRALGTGGSGGGLYINAGTAAVANGLSWGNAVPNNGGAGLDFRFVNGALDVRYTLLEAATEAAAFSCSNPSCGNDVYDAGPGLLYGRDPMLVDPDADVPELQATSPALDAGSDAHAATHGGDYFGAARINGTAVDLGAIERGAAPLPVELVAFSVAAETDHVRLSWTSRSEVGLMGYRILRRTADADDFAEIGETLAMGSGDYGFSDPTAQPGITYYYRLRSVDEDGATDLSAAVTATLPADADALAVVAEVFPNPASTEVRLRLAPRDNARTVYATLFDATGRKVRLWPLTTDGEHVLLVTDLPEGTYALRISEGDDRSTTSLLIHH